jgi:Fic family protein
MPLQIPASEYESLLQIVERHSSGVAVSDLLREPQVHFPKRTLQRRLDHLVVEQRLLARGEGRARRYLAAESSTMLREDVAVYTTKRDWLSKQAWEIRAAVERPLGQRMPVGYNGAFLDAYKPNITCYIPYETRRQLAELGQVGFTHLPAGTYLRQVMDRLLIDLSWNSSRLEGNTYSLLETQHLLEAGRGIEGKPASETQMILNHKAAIEMLAEQASEIGFNRYTICNLHALLSDNLLADPAACGRVRSRPVGIGGTVFHPLEVPQMIEERFEQILSKAEAIQDPFEQAFFGMVHLPYLQPFEDVNKRVSRLAANIPFIRHNLCPLSFIDVEQMDYIGGLIGVYELNRVDYLRDVFVWSYRRSCARYAAVRESLGDPDPFRLLHRAEIARVVREVVQQEMDRPKSVGFIAAEAERQIPENARKKFIEVAETELSCLHEGNIARYRLRPSEFRAWMVLWK